MKTIRDFAPADRYVYDFGLCSYKNGFAQVDTDQDAPWFGTWASPGRRIVVCYCEGDVTADMCQTDDEFTTLLRTIERWNVEQGYRPARIDPGFDPAMRAAFERLGLASMLP